jgi:hypothetical protein
MGQKFDGYEADVGGKLKYPVSDGNWTETGRNRTDVPWQKDVAAGRKCDVHVTDGRKI